MEMSISDAELARRRGENAKIYSRFPLGHPSADGLSSPFENAVALVRRPTAKLRNENIDRVPLRLLILKKGLDAIECELKVDNLYGSPDYKALSYVWGDPKESVEIRCCGQAFWIGSNLHSALKRLRSSTVDRILWVDAICINQADKEERAEQVAFMGRIYGAARHTLVWLGEPAEDVTAFDTIIQLSNSLPERKAKPSIESNSSQISNVNAEYPSLKNALNEVRFRHLLLFFSRSWFERVWVIQEVSRAKNVLVISGKQVLPWEKFTKVVLSFSDAISYLKKEYGPEESLRDVIALDNLPAMDSLRRNNEKMSLFAILCIASTYKSTDERDKLFALLALGDRASIRVQPDYIPDFFHVFRRHAIYELEERHRLDYLARPPIRRTDWPSWVPDWTEPSRSSYFYTALDHGFRAAGDTKPILGISKDKRVLFIKGMIVDYVDVLVDPMDRPWKRQLGTDSESVRLEELFQWLQECMACVPVKLELVKDDRRNPALQALLRTFACTGIRGIPRAGHFLPSLLQSDTTSIQRTLKDLYMAKEEKRDLSPALIALASQLYPAVADRQFFKTTGERLGWVSKRAIHGDAVCVLFGGTIPFVLRRGAGDEWKLVGECYVDGLMQGEGMHAEAGQCTFRIV